MGTITSNISIYIPSAGETNYDASFSAGMINIDQHDHSGPPTKGVPISSSGIAAGSITYDKLSANVADNATGIGTSGVNLNQLILLGVLPSIYNIATPTGFIAKNGTAASALTLTSSNVNRITIANGNGVGGNPLFNIPDYPQFLGVNGQAGTLALQVGGVTQANVTSGLIDLSPNSTAIRSYQTTFTNGGSGATNNVITVGSSQTWLVTITVNPNQNDNTYAALILIQSQTGATITFNEIYNNGNDFVFTSSGLTLILAIPAAVSRNIIVSGLRLS